MLARLACLFVLGAVPAAAQVGAPRCQIVVLNVVPQNLVDADKGVPALLTDILAQQVSADSGCQVVTQADLTEMLDFEAAKLACTDAVDSCLAELGNALGADRIVGSTVGSLGSDFVLNARLMNVKTGAVEARAQQVAPGAREQLRGATQNLARELFGKAPVVVEPVAVAPAPAARGTSPLVFVGAGVGALGVVGLAVGGTIAGIAESSLATPTQLNKTDIIGTGKMGLALVGVGALLTTVGVITAVVPMVAE
jgi:hypothetical protein